MLLGALVGCSTQRWPPPMQPVTLPLPPGEGTDLAPGLEEVEIIRHSDPVSLRRAGANAAFPMRFWDKKERARAGAWVMTDSGGRAELVWPRDGTSVVLFEEGAAQLGERDRGEPAVRLRQISRVRLQLGPDVLVELEGGAIFSADGQEVTGPFVIERLPVGDILRVFNKANDTARIEYRDAILTVGPGQVIDVPVLSAGAEPFRRSARELEQVQSGIALRVEGSVFTGALVDGAVSVEARSGARVEAQGVRVRLDSGERVHFAKLENFVVPLTSDNAEELQGRLDAFYGVEPDPDAGPDADPDAGGEPQPVTEPDFQGEGQGAVPAESPEALGAPAVEGPEAALEGSLPADPHSEQAPPPAAEALGAATAGGDPETVPAPDQPPASVEESDSVQALGQPTDTEAAAQEPPPAPAVDPEAAAQALRDARARRSLVAATALSNPTLLPQRTTGAPLLVGLAQNILRRQQTPSPESDPSDPDTGSDR